MRIQHNIPAMNSLTNYTRNNNALAGNLEKLSSGFRINSAADDAAGLAISEKMRSQIKGLEKAYDNANDGISLVQTAEGALTEVNSMLTRLTELATQSANGTYQDAVDRVAIQDETNALLDEIDRISDATNFNGIDLLNGNLAGGGKAGAATGVISGTTLADSMKASTAIAGNYKFTAPTAPTTITAGNTYQFELTYKDKNGNQQTVTRSYTAGGTANTFIDQDGKSITLTGNTIALLAQKAGQDFAEDENIKDNFTVTSPASGALEFLANDKGTSGAAVNGISIKEIDSTGATTAVKGMTDATGTIAKDVYNTFDVTKCTQWDPADEKTLADAIFEVNGEKFVFIKNGTTLDDSMRKTLNDAGVGNNYVIASGAPNAMNNGDAANMANIIKAATGLDVAAGQIDAANGNAWSAGTTGTLLGFKADASAASGSAGKGKGLVLQIGDTNDPFNKVTVSIDDMGADALGLRNSTVEGVATLNLSNQDDAGNAIATIKAAVNKVSAQRGKLGALQNRLDHTLNNLDATTENITSSESQIRDVNMAKEMTAYTKNNILAQAAQSMLAQANSMPQGVLQLLQ